MNTTSDMHAGDDIPLSKSIDTRKLPENGIDGRLQATTDQNGVIRAMLELVSLDSLSFEYRIAPLERNRVRLTGRLEAVGEQSCVITLEPLPFHLQEDVEIAFWPAQDLARLEHEVDAEAYELDPQGPEPMEDDKIDVGHLAYELLASGLDPYPRKDGAQFDWENPESDEEITRENPFDALAPLRDKLK